MKIKPIKLIIALIYALNLLMCGSVYADTWGWRQRLEVNDFGDGDTVSVSVNMKKTAEASYSVQYCYYDEVSTVHKVAQFRLSAAGKLLVSSTASWISEADENNASFIKADFNANTDYIVTMKYLRNTGEIKWLLDGNEIAVSTVTEKNVVFSEMRLETYETKANDFEWTVESITPGYGGVSIIETYKPSYIGMQGADNWYFCEYGKESFYELARSSDGKWKNDSSTYPYIDTATGDIYPSATSDVGFTFIAPKRGMVALVGTVEMPEKSGTATVTASIYKNRTNKWSGSVSNALAASYYLIIPVEKGDKLHFRINSNGSNSNDYTHWTPVVNYIDKEYGSDDLCIYLQEHNGEYKNLNHNSTDNRYYSDNGEAYIGNGEICLTSEYAIAKKYTAIEEGRHRIFGEFNSPTEDIEVQISKNSEVIWKQLLPAGENSVMDIKALLEINDVVEVKFLTSESSAICRANDLYIEYYTLNTFCKASTTVGGSYQVIDEIKLSDLMTNSDKYKTEFYSKRFSRKIPMTLSGNKWIMPK